MASWYLFMLLIVPSATTVETLFESVASIISKEFGFSNIMVLFETNFARINNRKLMNSAAEIYEDSLIKVLARNHSLKIGTSYLDDEKVNDDQIVLLIGNISEFSLTSKFEKFGRAKLLVVLTEPEPPPDTLPIIMSDFWLRTKASNGVVISKNGFETILQSWRPYSESCGIETTKITFVQYLKSKSQIFHDGHDFNLHQCLIVAGTGQVYPFVYNYMGGTYTQGIELEIFKFFASKLNFSFLLVADNKTHNGPREQSPQVKDLWDELMSYRLDFLFFGIPVTISSYVLTDPLMPYNIVNLVFAAPLPIKVPKWKMPLVVWDFFIMAGIVAVFITTTFVVMFLADFSLWKALFSTFAMFMGMPDSTLMALPLSALRIFLACFELACLTLTAIYSSLLYEAMTNGLQTVPVNDLLELARQDLKFHIYPGLSKRLNVTHHEFYNYGTKFNKIIWEFSLQKVVKDVAYQKAVASLSDINVQFLCYRYYKTRDNQCYIRMLKDRIATYSTCFFLWKGHPLKPKLDLLTLWMIDHGWVQYIIQKIANEELKSQEYALSDELQRDVGYFSDNNGLITFEEIYVMFLFLVACLILTSSVFVAELLFWKLRCLRNNCGKT